MKMNEDDRKKLEQFWRRKLWLGLAAIGAVGFAAWRVSAVQSRYDDVLVQESRELPEKVYQELIAEVRKGIPIVPVIPEGTDLEKGRNGSRCHAITALGYLQDSQAISELRKVLDNDLNRSASCQLYNAPYLDSQVNSVYSRAAFSIAQFQSRDSIVYLKQKLLKLPSSELIDVWREMYDRQHYLNNHFSGGDTSSKEVVSQYGKPLPNFGTKAESQKRNEIVLKSIREPLVSQEKLSQLSAVSKQENIPKGNVNSAKEKLFKNYSQTIFKRQNAIISGSLISNPELDDMEIIDLVIIAVQDNDVNQRAINLLSRESVDFIGARSSTPRFRKLLAQKIKQSPELKELISSSEFSFISSDKKPVLSTKNIPSLIRGLESKDINIRDSSAESLAVIGDPSVIPSLIQHLQKSPRQSINFMDKSESGRPMLLYPDVIFTSQSHTVLLKALDQVGQNPSFATFWTQKEKEAAIPILIDVIEKSIDLKVTSNEKKNFPGQMCTAASLLADLGLTQYLSECLKRVKEYSTDLKTDTNSYPLPRDFQPGYQFSSLDVAFQSFVHTSSEQPPFTGNTFLLYALQDKDVQVRRAAMITLMFPGVNGTANVSTTGILTALQDPDSSVRAMAAFYLRNKNLNKRNSLIESALLKSLRDKDLVVRIHAISGLRENKDEKVQQAILNTLETSDSEIKYDFIRNLPSHQNSSILISQLVQFTSDPNPRVRSAAIDRLSVLYCARKNLDCSENNEVNSKDLDLLTSILVKYLQDSDYFVKLIALQNTESLLNNKSVNDSSIAPLTINFLRSLNFTKDIPIEDWVQQSGQTNDSPLGYPLAAWSFVTNSTPNKYADRLTAIEVLQLLADRNALTPDDRKAAIPVLMSIYKNWNSVWNVPDRAKVVRLIRTINESEKVDRTAQQRAQQFFYLETGILGTIGVSAIVLLLSSIRLRNPFALFFSTYLLFPEEVVAELMALKQRRQSEKVRPWKIRLELAYEIMTLIWAFQIQIRIDDLKLPPGGSNRSAK